MNFLDFMDKIVMPDSYATHGLLDIMFDRQKELVDEYMRQNLTTVKQLPISVHTKEGQKIIREFMEYVVEELMEAANCLRNKPWQKTERETDVNHFYEELSDAVHFLLELFILIGFDAGKLYQLYMAKSEVNKFRQRSGY